MPAATPGEGDGSATPSTAAILVVDDEAEIRALLRDYFVALGHEVIEASNGLEALLFVKRHRPRLVVIDLLMPRLGGLDTIRHIQRFDRTIKIAVLSGHVSEEVAEELEGRGVTVLRKPFDLAAFRTVV